MLLRQKKKHEMKKKDILKGCPREGQRVPIRNQMKTGAVRDGTTVSVSALFGHPRAWLGPSTFSSPETVPTEAMHTRSGARAPDL